jgi:ASC-1-like (ASCH) protein
MAEIKSTLDIIMERTKNLTMTEQERKTFQRKEWEGKAKGWVLKHQDGIIDTDTLTANFVTEVRNYAELRQILKAELLEHIKLYGDNRKIFQLFEELLGINANTFEAMILSFKSEMDTQRIKRVRSLEEELRKRKICGSSLVPNPNHDGTWKIYIQKSESDFREQLNISYS